MSDVLKLEKPRVNKGVVEVLEDCLQKAKEGGVHEVMVLMHSKDNGLWHASSGMEDRIQLLGYLTHAIHEINTN